MGRSGKFEICKTIDPGNVNRDRNQGVFLCISLAQGNECLKVFSICFLIGRGQRSSIADLGGVIEYCP